MGQNLQQWDGGWNPSMSEGDDAEFNKGYFNRRAKIELGPNHFRLLPGRPEGWGGKLKPFLITHEHWYQTPDGEWRHFPCTRALVGQVDPLCDEAIKLSASKSMVDKERAKKLFSQPRCYLNVIDRRRVDDGPLYLGLSRTVWADVCTVMEQTGDAFHPQKGYDICITKKVIKKKVHHTITAGKRTQIEPQWMENLYNLDEFVEVYSYDVLVNYLATGEFETDTSFPPREERRQQQIAAPVDAAIQDAEFTDGDDVPD